MTKVDVRDGNIDGALRKLKTQVARSGVPSKLKERKFYVKPGVKNRLKNEERKRNARRGTKKNR